MRNNGVLMSFTQFTFHPQIAAGIESCGFTTPTAIQQEAIPHILGGRDIMGLAQTGTGKTAAFVLPLLQRLMKGPRKKTRALIVAPTRELAEQIHVNILKMAGKTGLKSVVVYGGVGKQPQIRAIQAGAEIIVACPGRLLDLHRSGAFSLKNIEMLVLDEADHMFDQGFLPDVRRILAQLPIQRQSLIFSATMPPQIRHLAEDVLTNPVNVQVNHTMPAPTITHALLQVSQSQKTTVLKSLLGDWKNTTTLVFTRTKHKAKSLAIVLQKAGHKASSLQGNMSQLQRQQAMTGFRNGTHTILVATDIAARGIDVEGISQVVNYDMPDTPETYTHRTGRTGRASKSGQAYTFASGEDVKMISLIERNLGMKMTRDTSRKTAGEEFSSAHVEEQRPKRQQNRKPAAAYAKKGQRKRASTYDFGLSKSARQ
jgi:superfamily II DNA/RNA helicase